ncbi:signal peptide peptidase SppA [Phycisphaerales bacterium AB-hyl4]|uniref:Signal peptide peptidase SppA n=1 Tax=Natronomicrosphaera hydrolytica TaxID=3242702 RepID=A0ABV4U690_9BACT
MFFHRDRPGSARLAIRRQAWLRLVLGLVCMTLWPGLVGCGPMMFAVGVAPGDQRLEQTTVLSDGGFRNDRIAIVDISGMMLNAEQRGLLQQGENPVSVLHEKLQKAAADPRVKAVVLRLNTPGGTVTATDAMYREVQRFRRETGKPVIALMMDLATSGGYYVACASDHIVAYPTSITGSVGVLLQTVSFKPALERWGIELEALTSGKNKTAGSMFETLTDEHREVLQRMVDDFYQGFVDVVRSARPTMDDETFALVTDGRVFTGSDAAALGLVDETGDLYDAFARAKSKVNLDRADLVIYHRPLRYAGSPYSPTTMAGPHEPPVDRTQINLLQLNVAGLPGFADAPVGLYYLWRPDMQ